MNTCRVQGVQLDHFIMSGILGDWLYARLLFRLGLSLHRYRYCLGTWALVINYEYRYRVSLGTGTLQYSVWVVRCNTRKVLIVDAWMDSIEGIVGIEGT